MEKIYIFLVLAGIATYGFCDNILWFEENSHDVLVQIPMRNKPSVNSIDNCVCSTPSGKIINSYEHDDRFSKSEYKFSKSKFSEGFCLIQISRVGKKDIGLWKCNTTSLKEHNNGDKIEFEIRNTHQPTVPEILNKESILTNLHEGSSVNLTCCSTKGIPRPNIQFYLDDKVSNPHKKFSNQTHTCLVWNPLMSINWINNQKIFKCSINNHVSLKEPLQDSQKISIFYEPKLVDDLESNYTIEREIKYLHNSSYIEIKVSANPKVSFNWKLKNILGNIESFDDEKITVYIVHDDDFVKRLILTWANFDPEVDGKNEYLIDMWNSIRFQRISLKVHTSNGLSWKILKKSTVIACILGGSIILLMIILLVVNWRFRINGQLCYKKSNRIWTVKNNPEGSIITGFSQIQYLAENEKLNEPEKEQLQIQPENENEREIQPSRPPYLI